jgi:hypothetical protein
MVGTGPRSSSFGSTLIDAAGCGASGRHASVRSCDAGMLRSLSRSSAHRIGHPAPQDLGKPFALPIDPIVAGRLLSAGRASSQCRTGMRRGPPAPGLGRPRTAATIYLT